eukprot:TRINITY_DN12431_c0_g1_i1.p1 TRINITY_DN12431_c0_g1~~TRINITY_DN12431_c0_g1_i1.p1  ORF type:complete len:284 (+),score=47.77 TRINITY_DN12431_c0_g1_i1:29-880(+)
MESEELYPYSQNVSNILSIILDCNSTIWSQNNLSENRSRINFYQLIECLMVFINTYFILDNSNKISIFAATSTNSYLLAPKDNNQQDYQTIKTQILENIKHMNMTEQNEPKKSLKISSALSNCLCFLNKQIKENPNKKLRPRILIISVSPDSPEQYIPFMNCIFSSQKLKVIIDSIFLGEKGKYSCSYLEQASHITGGIFLRPEHQQNLSQYLVSLFLTDEHTRKFLKVPSPTKVNYEPSCFCCHKQVPSGLAYTCSVCLSIYCKPVSSCMICHSKFELPKIN